MQTRVLVMKTPYFKALPEKEFREKVLFFAVLT